MKISTTLLPFALLFCFIPTVNAQDDLDEEDLRQWSRGAQIVATKSSNDVEGTPYYNEEWLKGYVLLESGKKSETVNLKYNSYTNELLFKKDGNLLAVLPNIMKGFVLVNGSRQTVFRNGFKSEDNDILPTHNLRIIHEGRVELVAKHDVRQHTRRDVLGGGNQVIKYLPKKDYYLITAGGKFHDIKLKEKDILKALNSHQKQLKNYAKKKSLSFKNENDLRSILLEYDNLLKMEK
jgi:hypothetical protein